jgi:ATP-binding cassette subfamily B protein
MRQKLSGVKIIWELIKILCNDFFAHFLMTIFLGILHGVASGLVVICTQNFLEKLQIVMRSNENEFRISSIVASLLVLGASVILEYILIALHNSEIEKYSFMMDKIFYKRLHDSVKHLGSSTFESKEEVEKVCNAENGAKHATRFINMLFIILFARIPYFCVVSIFLARIHVTLMFVLLLIFIPQLLGHVVQTKNYRQTERDTIQLQRLCKHYEQCIYDLKYAKETRYLGATEFFLKKYMNSLKQYNDKKKRMENRNFLIRFSAQIFTLLGYCGILAFLLYEIMHGNISIASFVTIFTSLHTLFDNVNGLIMEVSFGVLKEFASVYNYVVFILSDKDYRKNENYQLKNAIELHNVSYKYPGQDRYVLKNISLNIKKGETIALVGTNGAGKTTLAKLLFGILPVTEGEVICDNTKRMNVDNIKQSFSIVLQDFQKYYMTVKENIQIGESWKEKDNAFYRDLLSRVGLGSLGNQLDMVLLRKFGGMDLSIGQWQKLAIARGLYKESTILLLDEPTSAIDPLEEKRLSRLFIEAGRNKTFVLITHRLSSARFADRIVVLDKGRVICSGKHENLMNYSSFYKKMYMAQKSQYITTSIFDALR